MGPALHVGSGRPKLRIVFHKHARSSHKPVIDTWTRVDANREPIGPSSRLGSRLVKQKVHGHPVWAALITPQIASDLYLSAEVHWKDTDGCGGDQHAAWAFHLAA